MQEINNGKKNIDYLGIMRKSWQITWENKSLWWFGLFVSLGGGINFSLPFNGGDFKPETINNQKIQEDVLDFISQYASWIIIAFSIVAAMAIFFSILKIFGRIGLIKLADDIEKGKKVGFRNGIQEGKKFFWKIFFVDLLTGAFIVGIAVVLFLPVGYLFYLEALPAAMLSLFFAIIIMAALAILASFVRMYSFIYIILGRISVSESIENAYAVFNKNISANVIMLLATMLAGILFGVAMAVLLMGIVLFAAILGLILFMLAGKVGAVIAAVIGFLALIPGIFLVGSIKETFCQAAWLLFFREIAEIKEEEKAEETQQEVIGEKIPGTEAV